VFHGPGVALLRFIAELAGVPIRSGGGRPMDEESGLQQLAVSEWVVFVLAAWRWRPVQAERAIQDELLDTLASSADVLRDKSQKIKDEIRDQDE
jgi:hypothetical protein